jgi:hypothetical protein
VTSLPPTVSDAPFDRDALMHRLHGDAALAAAMAALMLQELPAQRDAVRDAVRRRDAAALFQSAHVVVSSVGNFLALDAVAAARRLETMGRDDALTGADVALDTLDAALDRLTFALQELIT